MKTATAKKNGACGYKAAVLYADGRTHIPVRKNFPDRAQAIAYAQKWIDANDARPIGRHKVVKIVPTLNDAEMRDIGLWFGWGSVLGYPTGPLDYLRDALKPSHRADFLAMPRPKRKAILRYIITEHARRSAAI